MTSYPLQTGRLVIEPLAVSDLTDFVTYRQLPEVARWQSWTVEYSSTDGLELIRAQAGYGNSPPAGKWLQLAVRSVDREVLYGDVAVGASVGEPDTFELGTTLVPTHQGQGLAAEAVGAVVEFLFTVAGAHRLFVVCDSRNTAAARLVRRIGFRHESHQVAAEYLKGEWTSVDSFALLAHEYAASASATRQGHSRIGPAEPARASREAAWPERRSTTCGTWQLSSSCAW